MATSSSEIITIAPAANEGSFAYNELVLPWERMHSSTYFSYCFPDVEVRSDIDIHTAEFRVSNMFRKLRALFSSKSFKVVHVHAPWLGAVTTIILLSSKPGLLKKTVYTVHSSYSNYALRNRLCLAVTFLFFKKIVFCSDSSKNSFPAIWQHLLAKKTTVVKNGVNFNRLQLAQKTAPKSSSNKFSIISVGRLIDLKNTQILLAACAKLQEFDFNLHIVGEGPLRTSLEKSAKSLGIADRVTFHGTVSREDVYGLLNSSNLFVSCSRIEGLPVAALEAMASKIPVILSDIPSHREIADSSDDLKLMRVGDINSLTSELKRIISMSDSTRMDLGQRCHRISKNFSLEKTHSRYGEIYNEVMDA